MSRIISHKRVSVVCVCVSLAFFIPHFACIIILEYIIRILLAVSTICTFILSQDPIHEALPSNWKRWYALPLFVIEYNTCVYLHLLRQSVCHFLLLPHILMLIWVQISVEQFLYFWPSLARAMCKILFTLFVVTELKLLFRYIFLAMLDKIWNIECFLSSKSLPKLWIFTSI